MYNGKIVVYTFGTFDMFHSNHLKMIKYARGLGDTLIIGVSTDGLVCSHVNGFCVYLLVLFCTFVKYNRILQILK